MKIDHDIFGKRTMKKVKIVLDIPGNPYYTTKGIEAWLSLVERCVRDAEAVGSNPVASINTKASWSSG